MNRNIKLSRVAALLGAVGGVSVVLGLGSTAASAGEQRLHNEFSATYGLIPMFAGSGNTRDTTSMKATKTSASPSRNQGSNKPDVPQREDPELPSYDGPDAPTAMKKS